MNDNDIIKALECCGAYDFASCGECAYFDDCERGGNTMTKDAIALITRQKAEIEKQNNDLRIWKDIAYRETGYVEIAKVDAIKEFAERRRG